MKRLTLQAMTWLAGERGGRCLSPFYVNRNVPLQWECATGHRWSAAPESIKKGSWCPACAGVRRLTLDEMQRLAETRGGRCLSKCCLNGKSKLVWRCSADHQWSATASQVKQGHWCPFCARVARLTLHELQQIAARKGGQCLSLEYANSSKLLRWRCVVGHVWQARAHSIRAGSWCPSCAHNQTLKLEEMQEIARERGGRCLSTSYKNGCTPLIWECEFRHRWKAPPSRVKNGSRRKGTWCPECYNSRRRVHAKNCIEGMRDLAIVRGGRCLSTEYVGSKSKLLWQCAQGHRWQALPAAIVQGSWCPACARNQRLGLSEFQDLARSRGGACLSYIYVNERTHLTWCCSEGHRWNATPQRVKRGSWCPTCANIRRRNSWAPRSEVNLSKLVRTTTGKRTRRTRIRGRLFRARVKVAK
jgi:hypothetical protein